MNKCLKCKSSIQGSQVNDRRHKNVYLCRSMAFQELSIFVPTQMFSKDLYAWEGQPGRIWEYWDHISKTKQLENVFFINELYNTFFSCHFLFDKWKEYGKSPKIPSEDLYQSSNSSFGTFHGIDPMAAYIPVEITLRCKSPKYSSQSLAITNLRDISW